LGDEGGEDMARMVEGERKDGTRRRRRRRSGSTYWYDRS
jgi:hypothetical protein